MQTINTNYKNILQTMIYRYIYKIICTAGPLKDHFYLGQHTSKSLNDRYKGSGKIILNYYKEYPYDYIKEIIALYNTEEELNEAEINIIKENINNPLCLNLRVQCKRYNQNDFSYSRKKLHVKHSKEEKQKNSEKSSGRTWMNNGTDNKFVKEDNINKFLNIGYKFGRLFYCK